MNFCEILTLLAFAWLAKQVNATDYKYVKALDSATTTIDIVTAFKMFASAFQRTMPCGYPPLNVPILAPFTVDNYNFNYSNGFYNISGNVSNLMVTGLDSFNFLKTNFNDTNNHTTFDLVYPEVHLYAESQFNTNANVAGYPMAMEFSGPLDMKLIDFRLIGEFKLAPNIHEVQSVHITDLVLHYYVGDVVINNWNNLWNIEANRFFNKWSRDFLLMWTEEIQRLAASPMDNGPSTSAVAAASAGSATLALPAPAHHVTKIQVRLAMLVASFPLSRTIGDIIEYIHRTRPEYTNSTFNLVSAFPSRRYNMYETVQSAGLANANIMQRLDA